MKRGASDSGSGTSPGHPTKLFKGSSDQSKNSEDGEFPNEKALLRNQNRRLAVELRRRQRQEADLEKKLAESWAKQGHFDATISVVKRAWDQVIADLTTAASGLGLGPRPLYVNIEEGELKLEVQNSEARVVAVKEKSDVKNEEKRGNAGGGKGGKGGKGTSSGSGAGTKIRTELTIMEKLLMPPAKVLATDATDSASGDRLLSKEQSDESGGPSSRNLLASMAGTSSAFYDLDSEGFGLSSRENIKELVDIPELDITEVEKGLQEKARFTAELAGRLFQAMHAHLTSLPEESRKSALHAAHLDLVAEKRKLVAENGFLVHQLVKAKTHCVEMSESLTSLREDHRKANRALDQLAERGIVLQPPSDDASSGEKGAKSGSSSGIGGSSGMHTYGSRIGGCFTSAEGLLRGANGRLDPEELLGALQEVQAIADSRQKECERLREEKAKSELELTRIKAATELDSTKADLAGHPHFQLLSTQLEAEQDMLKLEKGRVAELEGQLTQMAHQLQQHETALEQQMEKQRLRWKSEMHSSNTMLNTAHEELDKAQGKLRQEQRRDELSRMVHQTEQQISILKASLERASKAKDHAEAQSAKDRARLERQSSSSGGSREEDNLRAKLSDSLRELSGSKAIEDALQSELNTTLAAYAQSKESNQKLIQEIGRISQSQKELSEEVTLAKAQLKNRQQVRQTMELQIKTAAQMRDQGHALKQKALDLVNEAERKLQQERNHALELSREVHTEKAHADRARQEVDSLTQAKAAVESAHRELREHCERLNARMATVETELHHHKEQNASLNRKVEKHKAQNQKRNEKVANQKDSATEELREEELAELRKAIKCSVCQDRKKNRVITKCYHMFCDQCVSLNLKTRNRKCPACAKPFGQDDVHELWLT